MTAASLLFACRGLTKRFGDLTANQAIDLDVHQGCIHALLGENGAGKSTLMSMIAGRLRPDEGELLLRGEPVAFATPAQALAAGVGMVYQRFMLVRGLTTAENILLTAPASQNRDAYLARALELAERFKLQIRPGARIGELSMGERQRVEILKVLARDAELLILDEPTAILTPPEIDTLFEVLSRLREEGRAIIFITHKLEEVLALADEISVLRKGRMVARNLDPERIHSKRELARLMVGREVLLSMPGEHDEAEDDQATIDEEPVIEARNLAGGGEKGRPAFKNISFSIRRGEIFAVVGVAGNGQNQLTACLSGMEPFTSGALSFGGRNFTYRSWKPPRGKLAYVPEDRHRTGSVPSMSLLDNFLLTTLDRFRSRFGGLDMDAARKATRKAIEDFEVAATDIDVHAGNLSGGNLQKFLLAREFSREPDLFIAEQPTQGLDIRAAREVWRALLRERKRRAILLVTGDLKEALSLADRIAVMFRGRFLEIMDLRDKKTDPPLERIGMLMAGVQA
ncbi:ABC transporter ATP-binding protein [Oceanidesulfovibrio indonesiensis]|uniref:ABC transporter ATP-binding protein n=1 Tax=Oceanidesulfovibrio indonesiensis TaxID=54767 RepID=A0A7M3MI56_9BACT|nr:ABC transporter ATP-binding protein [Oceanidesulfovibrio indonesiensis]TVM18754.1 ABC transporter ATP-binding protein [Oceanidesulfovibrio indonesiensis]